MTEGVVETEQGKVAGERRGAHWAFRGIPFAAPPIGALRFGAPQPVASWAGVRDATRFGPSSLQGAEFAPGVGIAGPKSEDCLYLNVFTPAADGAKRPVMFFIHGGAFTVGSASAPLYDGAKLATQHDVVVVTTNYRVGALGFLALGEAGERWGAVDNRGILDQLAALRWVQTNIEHFGGDPREVTLFGESAGGTSVCLLLAMPSARGLFARAISQSPPLGSGLPTSASVAHTTEAYLHSLGLRREDAAQLLTRSADELMRAQAIAEEHEAGWPHFSPVESPLFCGQPRTALQTKQGSAVPLIIGYNRDEWNLFAIAKLPEWNLPLDDAELAARVERKVSGGSRLIELYRASRARRGLPHHNRALLRAIEGDLRFRMPALRFAALYRTLAPTHVYNFTYGSPGLRGELGACHALELPFVFGSYDMPQQERFAGRGEGVVKLSQTMMRLWTDFARGKSVWPCWGDAYETMELDVESRLVDDSFGEERAAWDGLV